MKKEIQTQPKIVHEPLGCENPYTASPAERDPRRPAEGQPVHLHVLTQPPGSVSTVTVELWSDDDMEQQFIPARVRSSDKQGDYWQAELADLEAGRNYFYCFTGSAPGGRVVSDQFSFEVYRKISVERVLAVRGEQDQIIISYQTSRDPLLLQLKLSSPADRTLEGQWSVLDRPPAGLASDESILQRKYLLSGFEVSFAVDLGLVSIVDPSAGFALIENSPGELLCNSRGKMIGLQQNFRSPSDEAFYGFGERYNALDQRGNILDNIVYDQWGPQGKRTYFPVPFFLSSKNYGFFLNTSRNVVFDMAASREEEWSFAAELGSEECLGFRIWTSPDPEQIVTRFTDHTGKPKLPPEWVFGLWMSSNCWNNQARVLEEVEKSIQHEIPASVVVLEAWSDETTIYLWNDAEYIPKKPGGVFSNSDFRYPESGQWPNPAELAKYLYAQGIRLVLWQVPVIKSLHEAHRDYGPQPQHEIDQAYAIENRFCLLNEDGTPYRIPDDQWFAQSLMIDFTHPGAAQWWMEKRRYLIADYGVAGFKTDGGEQAALSRILSASGIQGDELRNLYPVYYLKAYAGLLEAMREEDWVLFSRSGYVGAQRYSCHWAGDQNSSWETLRACLLGGLSIGLAGVSFWGWDLGGFSNKTPSAELYLRSAALAAFCPLMQFHSIVTDELAAEQRPGASFDRSPWNIQEVTGNPDVVKIFRKFVNIRLSLMPYLINEAVKSSLSGVPLMRSAAVFDPSDPAARNYPFEYHFGSDLLVAPVVEEGRDDWEVYLPKGEWIDFWSKTHYQGGRAVGISAPLDRIPVFIREGSVIPLDLPESMELGDPVRDSAHLAFLITPGETGSLEYLKKGQKCLVSYHAAPGNLEITIEPLELNKPILLLIERTRPEEVRLNETDKIPEMAREQLLPLDGYGWADWNDQIAIRIPALKRSVKVDILRSSDG